MAIYQVPPLLESGCERLLELGRHEERARVVVRIGARSHVYVAYFVLLEELEREVLVLGDVALLVAKQ